MCYKRSIPPHSLPPAPSHPLRFLPPSVFSASEKAGRGWGLGTGEGGFLPGGSLASPSPEVTSPRLQPVCPTQKQTHRLFLPNAFAFFSLLASLSLKKANSSLIFLLCVCFFLQPSTHIPKIRQTHSLFFPFGFAFLSAFSSPSPEKGKPIDPFLPLRLLFTLQNNHTPE